METSNLKRRNIQITKTDNEFKVTELTKQTADNLSAFPTATNLINNVYNPSKVDYTLKQDVQIKDAVIDIVPVVVTPTPEPIIKPVEPIIVQPTPGGVRGGGGRLQLPGNPMTGIIPEDRDMNYYK